MSEAEAGFAPGIGHMALPRGGRGPGILVLHAWWGLNHFIRDLCDRLAREGFVVLAPDLYNGRTAATIEDAESLVRTLDSDLSRATLQDAARYLHTHSAVRGHDIGVVGFSLGASWALYLSTLMPEEIAAVVTFYGTQAGDFTDARAAYQLHFAENDPWEPADEVRRTVAAIHAAGREMEIYTYPGAGHWFFEEDRPEAYLEGAAEQAGERMHTFLHTRLGRPAGS